MAARWAQLVDTSDKAAGDPPSLGALLALAYPDRVARNRGGSGAFLLANGRGAQVDPASALAREAFVVAGEMSGGAAQARILVAAPISLAEIETRFAAEIVQKTELTFDAASLALRGRRSRRLGAITLGDAPVAVEPNEDNARLLAAGIASAGIEKLNWSKALSQWRDRVMFLRRAEGEAWPDLSDTALTATIADWLGPSLTRKTAVAQISAADLHDALTALLPYALRRRLDADAPTHFEAPSGSSVPIDYDGEDGPKLAIRVQELFGLARHPTVAGGRVPLLVELLSPAHRPVQVTRDLPGFWRGSYAAVRTEMRGRYPRHPWPDDPLAALATRRAKPRGT